MTTPEILTSTAAAMAEDLAGGRVTSAQLTEAHLDRIDAVDGAVHAFLHLSLIHI